MEEQTMKQKVTSEFLKTHGFTNIETCDVDRQLGYEFWKLGTENVITNSDLHITLRNDGSFLVRYIDDVAHNLHTINELKAALRLFKCSNLVNLDEESPKIFEEEKIYRHYGNAIFNLQNWIDIFKDGRISREEAVGKFNQANDHFREAQKEFMELITKEQED